MLNTLREPRLRNLLAAGWVISCVVFAARSELATTFITTDAAPPPRPAERTQAASARGFAIKAARPWRLRDYVALFASVPPVKVHAGPLTLSVQADPWRGQALITATLSGTTVATQLLFLGAPSLQLDVAVGTASASGVVTLQLDPLPQYSSVFADVVALQGQDSTPFRGTITSWRAQGMPVVGDFVTILTGDLSTLTTVRGAGANIAEFSFRSHAASIGAVEATQFAPVQVFPNKIVAGHVYVEAGAKVTLTVPTALAAGWLLLQATFGSATTPPTPIAASVAQWNLPPAN
jgi:hypothetical protein